MVDKVDKTERIQNFGFATFHVEKDIVEGIKKAHEQFVRSAPGMSYKAPTKSDFMRFLIKLYKRDYQGRLILVAKNPLRTVMFDTQKWRPAVVYREQGHIVPSHADDGAYYQQQARRFNPEMFEEKKKK